jgi:hypothetical protein
MASFLYALLALFATIAPAEAGTTSCMGCYTACCSGFSAECGASLAWWNPPMFLTCAAGNCGGTCNHVCSAHCYPNYK